MPAVDAAMRHLFDERAGLVGPIRDRLRFAARSGWTDVTRRLTVPIQRGDGTVDEEALDYAATDLFVGLLVDKKFPGKRTAFESIVGMFDESGGDWSDAGCISYLIGRRRRYRLPRKSQPAPDCPAIWRWLAGASHTKDTGKRRMTRSLAAAIDHNTYDHGLQEQANSRLDESNVSATVVALLEQLRGWPTRDKMLLKFTLDGGNVKKSTVFRLIATAPLASAELVRALNVKRLAEHLNVPRNEAQKIAEAFIERLLSVRVGRQLAPDDIRHLVSGIEALSIHCNA